VLTINGVAACGDEPAEIVHTPLSQRVAAALDKGLPLVADAAMNYPDHRRCFSCHHQTLPMLAIVAGNRAGVATAETVLELQTEFTHAAFQRELESLRNGKGIGGRALTVGYGLAALRLVDWPADETTTAMVTYLVKTQTDDGHWHVQSNRPPLEESSESATAIAVAGLQAYGPRDTGDQSELEQQVEACLQKAKIWLLAADPESTEDKTGRLWGLQLLDAADDKLQAAREVLLTAQRDDGGWGQLDDMQSDAYATGQTLCVLMSTGLAPTDDACRRGIEFLLSTQCDDGSWFVQSRSNPIQVMFDNGDPHGEDQFISTPATCWALTALALWKSK
jgi:N-acyl-D-amino-acid deacylase